MQKNKVSPEFHSESFPLIADTLSVNHFDDDVFTLLYSDLSTERIPSYTYPHAGGKLRQESSIDYPDILNPVSLDEFSLQQPDLFTDRGARAEMQQAEDTALPSGPTPEV